MKNMIDTKTGKYLTQCAYDAWLDDDELAADMWTTDINDAAVFSLDDAPPADNRYQLADAK